MRLLQALAIGIPSWSFLYLILHYDFLCMYDSRDRILILAIAFATLITSVMAYFRCDLRIVLSRSMTDVITERGSSRANIAFLLTGLALGLFPALIWGTQLMQQKEHYREIARGVQVLVAYHDIKPGDTITLEKMAVQDILRSNYTKQHISPSDIEKIVGAKAATFIPKRTTILTIQLEGDRISRETSRDGEVEQLRKLRDLM